MVSGSIWLLWVVIIIIWLFCVSEWISCSIFFIWMKFRCVVGLLVRINCGFSVIVWVIVMCCCWLLFMLFGWCFICLLRLIWISRFLVCLCVVVCDMLVVCSGIIMFFRVVRFEIRLNVWKMIFILLC